MIYKNFSTPFDNNNIEIGKHKDKNKILNSGPRKAIILFSGGQDSTISLFWAMTKFEEIYLIGFDYEQNHKIELRAREDIKNYINANDLFHGKIYDKIINLDFYKDISNSALLHNKEIEENDKIPTSFVPGRNILFLTIAYSFAYERDITHLIAGMSEADYSGYPDCREETLEPFMISIGKAMEKEFNLLLPLINISKAASLLYIENLYSTKIVKDILKLSYSCYMGVKEERNDWGYGCGTCPACKLRIQSVVDYQSLSNAK